MTDVISSLLNMYEKHKEYLEDQISRSKYLDSKSSSLCHLARQEAYGLALDNIKSLFGEEK